ncbi:putative membrane protein [Halomicrobium zhouii]|uniref:Putative membrane protein n=1 Tax=Halomicrobium zhouii TaxID=767519 RepID=A0A1I6LYB6_9EURY|nr:PH domain-containing protein [Halomicrobium zhouii]SFS08388.1 putative membrane protein [Halomicrobium zhouii]
MRRLHPLSAVQRVIATAFRFGSTGFFLGILLSGPLDLAPFWATFALGGVGALAGAAYGVARYLRFTYETAGDTFAVSSGVLNRQEREIPLGRIQNVDVTRNLIQRALGLAVVNFETAGGGSTEAVLNAVDLEEARRLQEFVAAHGREAVDEASGTIGEDGESAPSTASAGTDRAGAVETGGDGAAGGGVAGDASSDEPTTARRRAPEEEDLYRLDHADLLRLGAMTAKPGAPVLVVVGTPFFGDLALAVLSATTAALGGPERVAFELLPTYSPTELAIVAGVTLVEFALATLVVSAVLTMVEFYDFRLRRVGDELRYERGFLNRYSGSIPVEKIQTVSIKETAPMRSLGYAGLSVETAGYGPGANDGQASNTAIPLDDSATVTELAESLGEFETPPVERPPRRARRRYAVRFALLPLAVAALALLVDQFLLDVGWWYAPLALLVLAPVAGHLTWKHRGHATTDDVFVARSGFWTRTTRSVPYYRVQTVIGSRSVFQRYRDLASVTADTASTSSLMGGDATAHDVDDATARTLHDVLRTRLGEDIQRRRAEEDDGSTDALR